MNSRFRQLFGLFGLAMGGVIFVFGCLLYLYGHIGMWLLFLITIPSGILFLLSSGYLILEYQTLAVLHGPS